MSVWWSHYCLNLHFPGHIWSGTSFHMLICHLCVFFGELSVKVFGPFLIRFFGFFFYYWSFNSFFVLDNSSIYSVSFANIFSLSVTCVLIFWHCLLQIRSFKFQWSLAYQLYLSCVIPLALYLNSYHQKDGRCLDKCRRSNQVLSGFLLCYLIGVLYLGLQSVSS